MKATIWSLLCPWRIFSRIWSRRSTARSAWESAIVSFWQTRQRSSDASAVTRASSAGSAAAGAASLAPAPAIQTSAATRMSTLPTVELAHEREKLVPDDLFREHADDFVADHPALVDHVR